MKSFVIFAATLVGFAGGLRASESSFEGLPPIRSFSFESIGTVSRGARLSFDGFGRLVVVEEGTYAVLNDSVWLDFDDNDAAETSDMLCLVQGVDGATYYGAMGDYGVAVVGSDGKVEGVSLAACAEDDWTRTAVFDDLVAGIDGVYFGSWNGVAYYEFATGRKLCLPAKEIHEIFRVGSRAYASTSDHGICLIDTQSGSLSPVRQSGGLQGARVEYATPLGNDRALLADSEERLWTFDGSYIERWEPQEKHGLSGKICGLQSLVDGGVAVAVRGKGAYLIDDSGELALALETPEYHSIYNMGANEPGVLWVVSERSVDKIQYGSPLTEFGQRLGLSLEWPQIVCFDDRLLVVSDGKLYEAIDFGEGRACRFELAETQLPGGARFLVSGGDRVLVGDFRGVYSLMPNGGFRQVAAVEDMLNLAMLGDDLCFAIGKSEIAVLGYRDGEWVEVAPRSEGVDYGPIVHEAKESVWLEMGGDGVARLWVEDGELRRMVVENDEWTSAWWVNVGVVGDLVALSGRRGERKFFDETLGDWCEAPELDALLNRYPKKVDRVAKDADGVVWATHSEGVVRFVPGNHGYTMDAYGLDLINDRYPRVRVINGRDVWILAGRSLMRVKKGDGVARNAGPKPMLVSLKVGSDGEEYIQPGKRAPAGGLALPYSQNSVSFRFFSGGYGWRSVPVYEYRLSEGDAWTRLDSSSLLAFGNLSEGVYSLQVRVSEDASEAGHWTMVDFEILAPWYRTSLAYALYGTAFFGILGCGMKFSSHLAGRRNRELERLVEERTCQLRSTMDRLNEETRNSATLAERNRLAGEIHDSLQQGIIGAIIQLDATLDLPGLPNETRSRLKIVRNMVSYVRQEVQHLVWDLDSTLHDSELGDVLKGLAALLCSENSTVELRQSGRPIKLPYSARHNLLRIAQESTTNAVRHSGASKIEIALAYSDDAVALRVRDNGVGFDPENVLSSGMGHFGLRGIRSRVKRLKGGLTIDSVPGEGTEIRVRVPVKVEEMAYAEV